MPDRMRTVLSQLVELWKSLSTAKRLALVFVTSSVLLAVLGLVFLGSRESFAVLYRDLPQDDAGKIVEDCKKEDFFGSPEQRSPRARDFLSKILAH